MAYRVTVHRRNIVTLVQVGELNRWTRDKAKEIEHRARAIAPVRTGRLRDSHVTLPTTGTNQYHKVYRISALAPYAGYVHGGTGIYGPKGAPVYIGRPMKIPGRNPNLNRVQGRSGTVIWSHKGQRGNNWLERAAEQVMSVT